MEEESKPVNCFVEDIRSFINDTSIENPESYFDQIAPSKEIKELFELIHTIEKTKKKIQKN